MKNEEILTKVMNKAIKNGFIKHGKYFKITRYGKYYAFIFNKHDWWTLEAVIFDHEFAKAIWPEKGEFSGKIMKTERFIFMGEFPNYYVHLVQLLLLPTDDKRIKYFKFDI